jgi:hypothetical protein
MPQLNVCAERFMEHFIGCWLRILGIGHNLFDADDLLAFRTLAEAVTSVIHFYPWSKPPHVGQVCFVMSQFPHRRSNLKLSRVYSLALFRFSSRPIF